MPGYKALLLRKNFPQLSQAGGLIDRSKQWLTGKATWNDQKHRWSFPSGAILEFGHLQRKDSHFDYQGAEYDFCVSLDTPILMADHRWKAISSVSVGDWVATLEGPRPVTRTHRPGVKEVVKVTTETGSSVVSLTHRLLTPSGWASPEALRSTQCRECGSRFALSAAMNREAQMLSGYSLSDRWQACRGAERSQGRTHLPESAACSEAAEIGCAKSDDSLTEPLLPEQWISRLVLFGPDLRSNPRLNVRESPSRVHSRDLSGCEAPGSRNDCPACSGSGGGQPLRRSATDQGGTQPQAGAAVLDRFHSPPGGPANTRRRNRLDESTLRHPYTCAPLDIAVAFHHGQAHMVRAGEAEVADLTVAGGSHYVSYGGIVSSNCGFDELTHFEEEQYLYLFSRLRSAESSPIPPRMRAASNPGGKGHSWVKRRFIDKLPDPNDPRDTSEKCAKRIFIPARLVDNPGLNQDEYLAALGQLDAQTEAQLRDGDWNARGSGEWVYDQDGIDAAEALGRLLDGNPPEPSGGRIDLGIDWGESTHAVTIWPLERGGIYVTAELALESEEPTASTARMLRMAEGTGWPLEQACYDAAGVQSMRTFTATARRTHPDLRTMKIPFSKYKVETIGYLRRLFERTAAGESTEVIAISPTRCPILLEQLRNLQWKDPDLYKVEKGDDHGPDALIAGAAPIAARKRNL